MAPRERWRERQGDPYENLEATYRLAEVSLAKRGGDRRHQSVFGKVDSDVLRRALQILDSDGLVAKFKERIGT